MLPVRPWQQQGQQAPAVYACEAPASSRQPATRKPRRGSSLASPDAGHTALSQHDHAARRPAPTARASCRPPPCLRCRVRWSGLPARPPRLPRRAAAARWLGCRQVAAAPRGAGLPSGRGRCPGSCSRVRPGCPGAAVTRAARARPTVGKKNSNAEEAVALLPAKGAGTATAHVVVQHSARHANHSPNNKLGARLGAARTPTKDDIV